MQIMGFSIIFALFLASGLALPNLTASQSGLQALQAMYYLTSFFGQVSCCEVCRVSTVRVPCSDIGLREIRMLFFSLYL